MLVSLHKFCNHISHQSGTGVTCQIEECSKFKSIFHHFLVRELVCVIVSARLLQKNTHARVFTNCWRLMIVLRMPYLESGVVF